MKIEIDITPQQIADQMITAIEGGANYWCGSVRLVSSVIPRTELAKPWYSDPRLYADDFTLAVDEMDEDTEAVKTHTLTPANFAAGLKLMAEKHSTHFGDLLSESNADATTADVFLQCVALSDVVYG